MARGTKVLVAGAAIVAAVVGWVQLAAEGNASPGRAAGAASSGVGAPVSGSASASAGAGGAGPFSAAGLQARQEELALWRGRYERAEQIYASYRDATRYPHESRPISEHPDQVRPFDPVSEENTLRKTNGEAVKGLRLRTTQDRDGQCVPGT